MCWQSQKELLKKFWQAYKMYWHSLNDLVKIVGKLRNMLVFPELVVKKKNWQA